MNAKALAELSVLLEAAAKLAGLINAAAALAKAPEVTDDQLSELRKQRIEALDRLRSANS